MVAWRVFFASATAVVLAAGSPPDGSVARVTASGSDALLAFSAARLRTDPAHSLIATSPMSVQPSSSP